MNLRFGCPVCFDIPPGIIYQCRDGHIVCERCHALLNSCPECRIKYGVEIRNRALEIALDDMSFPCEFKEKGCSKMFTRLELSIHTDECQFNSDGPIVQPQLNKTNTTTAFIWAIMSFFKMSAKLCISGIFRTLTLYTVIISLWILFQVTTT